MLYTAIMLQHIGSNLRRLRRELGLSQSAVAKMLGVSRQVISMHENRGFGLPRWSRYMNFYKDHPDLRGNEDNGLFKIAREDLFDRSELQMSLESMYGRDGLKQALKEKDNEEIVEDLREYKYFKWGEKDIDSIRWRIGLIKRRGRGYLD